MSQPKEPERRERAETELPIDIDYAKFLPWLIDRRRIPKNWHVQIKSARTLARAAYTDTPKNLRAQLGLPDDLPVHESLTYQTARTILSKLTSTEIPADWGAEKDMLGRFKNPCQRAWANAVAAFEKGCVHLADDAQQLVRNADIGAPALRKEIMRLTAEAADLSRKEGPTIRNATEARQRYDEVCTAYEFDTNATGDFHKLLNAYVQARVPNLLREAAVAGRELADVLRYYSGFAVFIADGDGVQVCETLRGVIEGDLDSVVRAGRAHVEVGCESVEGGIDWGIEVEQVAEGGATADGGDGDAGIDWGIEVEETTAGGSGADGVAAIDWGIEVGNSGAGDVAEGGGAVEGAGGIDWDIEVVTEDEEESADRPIGDGITLADGKVRDEYLNDLHELEAFLSRRAHEMGRAGVSDMGVGQELASGMPTDLREVTEERVRDMQERVMGAIHALNSQETRYLLALHSNARVFERAAREILEKRLAAERLEAAIETLRSARRRVTERVAVESPKLKELARVTRELLKDTETALSTLYQGRKVNILGEINNIFPPES